MVASSSTSSSGNMEKKLIYDHQNESISRSNLKIDDKLDFLPHFRGVDERAEEFISKFRQEMKLEREKSIIDFQEMLARSS